MEIWTPIDPRTTPEWAKAAEKSLKMRGENHTGWGTAWRIACYARLGLGEEAHGFFKSLIKHCEDTGIVYRGGGGTYDNLFTCHSPFQIDSNFGFTAAVAEMLLQSQNGSWKDGYEIDLLPALPQAWANGSVTGLKARGNVEVDLQWENHKLKKVMLTAITDRPCRLKYAQNEKLLMLRKGEQMELDGQLNSF